MSLNRTQYLKDYRLKNRERARYYGIAWRKANPEKVKELNRAYSVKHSKKNVERASAWGKKNPDKIKHNGLKSHYGISLERFKMMFHEQGGLCGICKEKKALGVDHCHESNLVRGLLCTNCNLLLGHAKDNKITLRNAVKYLEKFEVKSK